LPEFPYTGRFEHFSSNPPGPFACDSESALKLTLSPDGIRLASGGYDGQLYIWDTESRALLRKINLHKQTPLHPGMISFPSNPISGPGYCATFITAMDWSPDGKRLAVVCGSVLHIIGTYSGTVLRSYAPTPGQTWAIRWLDNKHLISVCCDGYLRSFDGTKSGSRSNPSVGLKLGTNRDGEVAATNFPYALAIRPGWFCAEIGGLALGYREGFSLISNSLFEYKVGTGSTVEAIDYSANASEVILGDHSGMVFKFDLFGSNGVILLRHESAVRCMAKNPNSAMGATGDADGFVKIWHEGMGVLHTIQAHVGPVVSMAASRSFDCLYTVGADKTIKKWSRVDEGRRLFRMNACKYDDLDAQKTHEEHERHLDI
jgi:WD40 repeat protein